MKGAAAVRNCDFIRNDKKAELLRVEKVKKRIAGFAVGILLAALVLPAEAGTNQADTSRKVYDYAGLLSEDQAESLEAYAEDLSEAYEADFVVVTIIENDKRSSQDYADRFFDDNGFGFGEKEEEYGKGDGMLFLIDMENREYVLSTSGVFYKAMDDSDVEEFLDYVEADMRAGNYYEACRKALEKGSKELDSKHASEIWFPILGGLLSAALITGITLVVLIRNSKKSRLATEAGRYMVQDSLHITRCHEVMTGSHTAVSPLPEKSNHGSSRSSGGGGSHKSSRGATHGGGSRKF